MKKITVVSLITILLVSLLVNPTFAGKPENPGNSSKIEKTEKGNPNKEIKGNKEKEATVEDENQVTGEATTEDGDQVTEETPEETTDTSDKVGNFLEKWQKRYKKFNTLENEETNSELKETETVNDDTDNKKDNLPPGLQKREDALPPGLATKEILPYGLLKRIDPDAIPKGQITDTLTGDTLNIKKILADSVTLLESAVEGDGLGEYFSGSIETYDTALTAYTDLVKAGESTKEELETAANNLNEAYNTFIMSRTATIEELTDYNNFLKEVDEIIEDLEIGSDDGEISLENYQALTAYFDSLEPYNTITDEEDNLTPDAVSIEAMLTLFNNATEKFDELLEYQE